MDMIPVQAGSFLEITREERFFCALLTHGVLSSASLRSAFYERLSAAADVDLDPSEGATEVYTEVAWLRDHWRNLGDPAQWNDEIDARRAEFLEACLNAMNRPAQENFTEPFFRTSGNKLMSPGRWKLEDAQQRGVERLKWAFNAKPDFAFVCSDRAVLLEVKVESPPGAEQDDIQGLLCDLMWAVSPYLTTVKRAWLANTAINSGAHTVLWAEVARMVQHLPLEELDDFTRRALRRFAQRAAGQVGSRSDD